LPTTTLTNQFKIDSFNGGNCLQTTQTGVTCTCSSTTHMTGLASTAGLSIGMAVTGTNSGVGGIISKIVSSTAVDVSVISSGALTSATFTGDTFYIALIKVGFAGTYDQTFLNYGIGSGTPGVYNLGTDEIANGSGYTTNGVALTSLSAIISANVGVGSYSVNPSWSAATISSVGALIYNNSARIGSAQSASATLPGINNHSVSLHDFGGTYSVVSGTLTLTMPTQNSTLGLLRIA
jgi:hypothetical protein